MRWGSAVVSTGFASGAVLGGLLVQESWRLVFFVNAPIGVLLLAGFVLRERRAASPLLDLALFADRGIRAANLTLLAVGAYNAGEILLVTLYLQEGRHLWPVLTGLCFVPQAVGAFALAGPGPPSVVRWRGYLSR
jgi:MFS family permease